MAGPAARRLSYDLVRTPLGELFVAARGGRVCRIALRPGGLPHHLRGLSRRFGSEPRRDPRALTAAGRQLRGYLEGRLHRFSLEADLTGLTPFQVDVLTATAAIPYGQVASYGEIASRIGRPRAARAVGNALNANPVPILVPCHRVVAGSGLGGFGGGVNLKRRLLGIEGWA